jgi:hypothetical protein
MLAHTRQIHLEGERTVTRLLHLFKGYAIVAGIGSMLIAVLDLFGLSSSASATIGISGVAFYAAIMAANRFRKN